MTIAKILTIAALSLASMLSTQAWALSAHDCDRMYRHHPHRHHECMRRVHAEQQRFHHREERRMERHDRRDRRDHDYRDQPHYRR